MKHLGDIRSLHGGSVPIADVVIGGSPCQDLSVAGKRAGLQGYPDGWTDIGEWTDGKGRKRKTTDEARYKALGNTIALPPWRWVLARLCERYDRRATMASLFDGIGGFPLIWEELNGKGSCLWSSEIEDFPIAVTKRRFGEN